ncbi:MAG: hypothetical protein AAGI23_00320 [Bacteroidota bacterium]
MRKFTFFLFLLHLATFTVLEGQNRPSIYPNQLNSHRDLNPSAYCRPGINNQSRSRGLELSYRYIQGSQLERDQDPNQGAFVEPITNRLSNLTLKTKFPIFLKPNLKVIGGYTHERELYDFDSFGDRDIFLYESIEQSVFKRNSFNLITSYSFNDRYYMVASGQLSLNGNQEAWIDSDKRFRNYNFILGFGNKRSQDFEWGVGAVLIHNLENRNNVIPFLLFNKNISDRWGVEGTLPISFFVRHNPTSGTILLSGVEYVSQAYAMVNFDFVAPDNYILDHGELRFQLALEQRIVPWVWLDVQVGYQLNFNNNLSVMGREDLLVQFDPKDTLFFKIGVFASPPDDVMNR